ncbi:MAG: fluoride efflux transporter CrcB [Oscillospiraceae bacterium]|jgi:CrcB protein|nr:fluoride efflux transporter CrcB [Oscillospiraceae bacterium]
MNLLINCICVGCGGMLGAVARYLLGYLPIKPENGFPVITLLINIAGAFFIGLIAALAGRGSGMDPRLLLFLKVGICGGFTTFSTFSLESVSLLQQGRYLTGIGYILCSVIFCVAAVAGAELLVQNCGALSANSAT